MSNAFDPYHKWLGIPPAQQPADHYRLLGVARLESDPDVIAMAADQRMAFLRSFQNSEQSELSQQLLNEVATAKLCLLNAREKAAYDAELAQKMPPNGPPPLPEADDSQSGFAAFLAASGADRATTREAQASEILSSPRKKKLPVPLGMVAAVVVLVLILIGVIFWAQGTKKNTQRQQIVQHDEERVAAIKVAQAELKAKEEADRKAKEKVERKAEEGAERKPKPEPTPKPAPKKPKPVPTPAPISAGDDDPEAAAARLLQNKGLEEGFNGTWQLVNEQTRKLEALETSGSSGTAGGAAFEAELKRRVDAKKKAILDRWIWVSQQPAGNPAIDAEYHHLMTIVGFPDDATHRYVKDEVSEITSIRAQVKQEFASRAPATVDPAMAGLIEDIRKRYATLAANPKVQAALKTVDGTLAGPPNDAASTEPAPAGDPDAQVAENDNAGDEVHAKPPLTHFLQRTLPAARGPRKLLTERGLVEQNGVWIVREAGARRNLQNAIRQFSPRQQELLEDAIDEYRNYTKIIYGGMLNDAQKRATSAGRPGSIAFRDKDWARFDFLARHHPDINAEEFGIVRMSSTLFFNEALTMALKRFKNNPKWGAAGSLYRNPQREQQVKEAREAELEQNLQHRYQTIAEDRDVRRALKRLGHRLAGNPGQTSRSLPPTVDRKRPAVFHQNPFQQNPAATFDELKEQLTAAEKQTKIHYAKFNKEVKEYHKRRNELENAIQPLQRLVSQLQQKLDATPKGKQKVAIRKQIEAGPIKKLKELQQKLSGLPEPNPAQFEAAFATAGKLLKQIRGKPEYAENESSIEKLVKKIEKTKKAFAVSQRKLAKNPK